MCKVNIKQGKQHETSQILRSLSWRHTANLAHILCKTSWFWIFFSLMSEHLQGTYSNRIYPLMVKINRIQVRSGISEGQLEMLCYVFTWSRSIVYTYKWIHSGNIDIKRVAEDDSFQSLWQAFSKMEMFPK